MKTSPIRQKRHSLWTCALLAAGVISVGNLYATEYDLSKSGTQSFNVPGAIAGEGTAIISDYFSQPTGTGVFQPFLTIEASGNKTVEQGYNTDGHTALYNDQQRPEWNNLLRFGDLTPVTVNGKVYYAFVLDANEPGGTKSTISIDNIRIYTSDSDKTASVGSNLDNLDTLGTLRWTLNDPIKNTNGSFKNDNWVKLDASQENVNSPSNGGSGKSDMVVLIPQSSFLGVDDDDYVWFWNLDGAHYTADKTLGAQAGYEEWQALAAPHHEDVPDGGATLVMLGMGLAGIGMARRKSKS